MSGPTGWEDEPAPEEPAEVPRQPYYGSLPEFMRDFFVPMFPRDVTHTPGLTWCPKWWLHLDAALGTSNWIREHLDHHLPLLLSDAGPFKGCSITKGHTDGRDYMFPLEEPSEGLYVNEHH